MNGSSTLLLVLVLTALGAMAAFAQGDAMTDFETGTVEANGIAFHYLAAGKGPIVLALHGFPDSARSYRHQMPALAAAGYRVVAPFMRGYAPTEIPEGGYFGVPALAADAVALAKALSEQPVILIGHDWGAAAAHAAAAMAPERFSKLITIAVPYGPAFTQSLVTSPDQQRRSWYMFYFQLPFAETAVAMNDFAFIDRLWRDWSPGWEYPPAEMKALKATLGAPGVLTAALSYYRHTFNPPPDAPSLAEVSAPRPIAVPTLYLHGRNDGCIGVELADGMEAYFAKGLRKEIIDGAGHFVHQEKPDEVNRLILEFIR
jgi:pimeloyl-ACP methyl ester carboxylesterase